MHSRIDSLFSTILLILAFTAIYAAMPHKTASTSVARSSAAVPAHAQVVSANR